jgi:hypothetical protein
MAVAMAGTAVVERNGKLTEVGMYAMVRARLGALVCGMRGWCRSRRDAGMVTSEYALGIVAAAAFAVVLYKVVTSGQIAAELQAIVKRALDEGA